MGFKMFYRLHDMQYAALMPARMMAEAAKAFLPIIPGMAQTPGGNAVAATAEMFERATRQFEKPNFNINSVTIDGKEIAVTEKTVLRKPFCHLLHFCRTTNGTDPKVLLVAPMSGNYATLLRGTVAGLLEGHDVYVTDWKNANTVPVSEGSFDLDDYIGYIMDMLHFLGGDIHVIAVCQAVVPVVAAIALLAQSNDVDQPLSMSLISGPIDTRRAGNYVSKMLEEKPLSWFKQTVIDNVPEWYPGAGREVYPGFVQLGGLISMHLDEHITEHMDLFKNVLEGDERSAERHRKFYDEYFSVMDLPAEFYLQTIKTVFQDHALPKGKMRWRGIKVNPAAIKQTALLTIEGEKDDIAPPGQTVAAHDLCSSLSKDQKQHHLQKGVGHFGLFNGRLFREELLPVIAGFIRKHSRELMKETTKAVKAGSLASV